MNISVCCFAARRYWTDEHELNTAFDSIKKELSDLSQSIYLVDDEFDLNSFNNGKDDLLIAIPMSGAVQPRVLNTAKSFGNVLLLAGYINGMFENEASRKMLINNAAPAVMDIYAVLKREREGIQLCVTLDDLKKRTAAIRAVESMKGERILAIGKTEPWVISSVKDFSLVKERFQIEVVEVMQKELIDLYNETSEYENCAKEWTEGATGIVEPTLPDVSDAARFQTALLKLLKKYKACGAAIACFDMLKTGTTACLGVSYINTYTDYVVSCEGDMDSALTMLLMKRLSHDSVWMANPNIQPDGTVNFVHCTAPTVISGKKLPYVLRNHHESGIGVSTEVQLPTDTQLSVCRISNGLSDITISCGVGKAGEYEPSCRTQLKVKLDSFDKYIKTALGCHQVFVFSDITKELTYAAELLKLNVL